MRNTTASRRRLIRTVATAIAGVLVVVGIALLVLKILAPSEEDPERPSITATVDGRSVEVRPFTYCDVKRPDICDAPGETVDVPVSADQQLEISLPESISSAPWILATFYVDPDAPDADTNLQGDEQYFRPDAQTAVMVPGLDDQGRALAGVEVRLPTGLFNPDTNEDTIVTHATWSVSTR